MKNNKNLITEVGDSINPVNTYVEVLMKRGYYKISFKDSSSNDFVVLHFKEDIWSNKLMDFINNNYPYEDWSIKKIDYVLDHRETEG